MSEQTLKPYTPSWRDRLGAYLYDKTSGSPTARNFVGGLVGSTGLGTTGMGLVDATPVGVPLGMQEAYQAGDAKGMALAALPMPAGKAKGIIAYHGSPHSFDRFDLSKIGTGEGAQAYGHGLYFADQEDVARGYRDRIAGANWIDKRGVPLSSNTIANDVMDQARKDGLGPVEANDAAGMWSIVARDGEGASNFPGYESVKTVLDRHGLQLKPNGHMYQVRINADPEHFLDWDKPLSEQSPVVQGAISGDRAFDPTMNGTEFFHDKAASVRGMAMQNDVHPNQLVSEQLREAGIPGIKYLDQGSRGAGEGSRNYVVFDDKLVEILKKYGLAGLLGGGAGMGMLKPEDAQAVERVRPAPTPEAYHVPSVWNMLGLPVASQTQGSTGRGGGMIDVTTPAAMPFRAETPGAPMKRLVPTQMLQGRM